MAIHTYSGGTAWKWSRTAAHRCDVRADVALGREGADGERGPRPFPSIVARPGHSRRDTSQRPEPKRKECPRRQREKMPRRGRSAHLRDIPLRCVPERTTPRARVRRTRGLMSGAPNIQSGTPSLRGGRRCETLASSQVARAPRLHPVDSPSHRANARRARALPVAVVSTMDARIPSSPSSSK